MGGQKLIGAPAVEPVTVEEMKLFCRIDTADDDALIGALIVAARQWAENETGCALISQTWRLCLDSIFVYAGEDVDPLRYWENERAIIVPHAPLQSLSQVLSFDESGRATALDPALYEVDTMNRPGRLLLKEGAVWPSITRKVNAIQIDYVAGYGDGASDVPEPIRLAIRQAVAFWYERRGDETGSSIAPVTAAALLTPYRVMGRR